MTLRAPHAEVQKGQAGLMDGACFPQTQKVFS